MYSINFKVIIPFLKSSVKLMQKNMNICLKTGGSVNRRMSQTCMHGCASILYVSVAQLTTMDLSVYRARVVWRALVGVMESAR